MKTPGSHGPSGLEVHEGRKKTTILKDVSSGLSRTTAKVDCRITTEAIAPEQLKTFDACRLLPLDQKPSFYLIGLGEKLRRKNGRIIKKCIS